MKLPIKSLYRTAFPALCISVLLLKHDRILYAQTTKADTTRASIQLYKNTIAQNVDLVKYIQGILQSNGLPKALSNLALIESSFDRTAISNKNAGGLWQFTAGHASGYGLKDEERFDIYKSTKAVCLSLKKLYAKYNNWLTVVAAYNCGEKKADEAIYKANSTNFFDYCHYLPGETTAHVIKFRNACLATNDLLPDLQEKINSTTVQKQHNSNPNFSSIEINTAFSISIISQTLNIAKDSIRIWNPQLEATLKTTGKGMLTLPTDKATDFEILKTKILIASLKNDSI